MFAQSHAVANSPAIELDAANRMDKVASETSAGANAVELLPSKSLSGRMIT